MNPANEPANKVTVENYLLAAYEVDPDTARALVNKKEHRDLIEQAVFARSHAYYPGDRIARLEGLVERDDYDPDPE